VRFHLVQVKAERHAGHSTNAYGKPTRCMVAASELRDDGKPLFVLDNDDFLAEGAAIKATLTRDGKPCADPFLFWLLPSIDLERTEWEAGDAFISRSSTAKEVTSDKFAELVLFRDPADSSSITVTQAHIVLGFHYVPGLIDA